MTWRDRSARVRSRAGGVLGLLVLAGVLLGFAPLSRVLAVQSWLTSSLVAVLGVVAIGYLARKTLGATMLTPIVQAAFVIGLLTATFAAPFAVFVVIPTPDAWWNLATSARFGIEELRTGVAPLAGSPGTGVLVTAAFGGLAIALDLLVVRLRMVAVGVVVVLALALWPGLYLPSDADLLSAILALVVGVAMLIAARPSRPRDRGRRATSAVVMTVPAVLVALVAAPLVPLAAGGSGGGLGGATAIDASIDLGRDLRNPRSTPVLSYHSDAAAAPYLRLATMSSFDGGVWLPDVAETPQPLSWLAEQRPLGAGPDAAEDAIAHITMGSVSTSMLPMPAGATGVEGVSDNWLVDVDGRTVSSPTETADGRRFDVSFAPLDPTTQQLRSASFSATTVPDSTRELLPLVPSLIGDELQRVTDGEDTTFDKLMALQSWFRSSEYTYSLDTPVEEGYDRPGFAAMEDFLTVKSGYCVHFAATFAVMARMLGAPSRVVLGFLPGEATNDYVDDQRVYTVDSSRLHTWPEVYFDDIGWVPFEPTASLGVASTFRTASQAGDPSAAPSASAAPLPSASPAERDRTDSVDSGGGITGAGRTVDARLPLIILAALVLLAAPGLVRRWMRRRRMRRTDGGDVIAAWEEVLATAIDLGIPAPVASSPRVVADAVRHAGGDLTPLVRAVEHRAYARDGDAPRGPDLVTVVAEVRATWTKNARPWRRALAAVAPLSLVRRPVIATRPGDASEADWSRAPARTG